MKEKIINKRTKERKIKIVRKKKIKAEKSSYQEAQRQTATVGNTDNERQSHASTLSYGIGACIRNYS